MPLYDLACENCGTIEEHVVSIDERNKQVCATCGNLMQVIIGPTKFHPFKSGYYEHIATTPLYIDSKRKLRDACKEHGVTSIYLEDS